MSLPQQIYCTAFQGLRRIATGLLPDVALKTKQALEQGGEPVLQIGRASCRERVL